MQSFKANCKQYENAHKIDESRSEMTNYGLGDWIHRHRIKSAGRIAVTAGNLELTYQQFGERINRLANALTDRGVNRGDRVAYLGENSIEFLEKIGRASWRERGSQ